MKRVNTRLIHNNRVYNVSEISKLLNRSKLTVLRWLREGLPHLGENRPYLILGKDLRKFLECRREKNRKPISPGQFYCVGCHAPRYAAPGSIKCEHTRKRVGKDTTQVIIHAICSVCGRKMSRLSTERKMKDDIG